MQGVPTPFVESQKAFTNEEMDYWNSTLAPHYLETGAIKVINPIESEKFISRAFMVPKSSGGFRLVIDLRRIN
jgi:hypothetical protein